MVYHNPHRCTHDKNIEISLSNKFPLQFVMKGHCDEKIDGKRRTPDDKICCCGAKGRIIFFQLCSNPIHYAEDMCTIPCMFYCRFGVIFFQMFCF